ncbi:FGGY-family carbohydrate kinase [Vibrio nigripulchritudo]|uniref:FGGY-family carbohydrate kinase n=1 Tax=Vibrio nigripulchritudo TaxID=28173 RepID=UPI00249009A0|nr:FGGY family carbohydrate kinase [Vibrio nigripulchritudo]BDU38302.1 xylulokinase [Vibrio nigripulchritudo]BDU44024.1 xylulokinase [Vibrio nigripulchritudo]
MDKSEKLLIGVDSSTSATKVIVFSMSGKIIAESAHGYPLIMQRPGWVEQKADDWWNAFIAGCLEVMSHPDVDGSKIAGIGITHQRFTFVPVDSDIRPLRNAILWNDIRCSEEAEFAGQEVGVQQIFEKTGYAPGQWTLYKALWLKRHEPDVYSRTYKLMLVQDYLIYKLTSQLVTLSGAATMTGALDIEHGAQWASDIIDSLGVRKDIWIDTILPGCSTAGSVTAQASQITGLPQGIPVVVTAGDQPCGILGAGVTEPGEIGINGGTSCTNEMLVNNVPSRAKQDYVIEISPSGNYVMENYIPSGGSALMKWYRDHFCLNVGKDEACPDWSDVYRSAEQSPVGNMGMMILPYFQGANGPYWDLNARGMAFGLHTEHGQPQVVRGIMEGLAYESRRQGELMEAGANTDIEQIKMYGGSARSDVWNQIFADVFNKTLLIPETSETTALGAAISAAVGCGEYSNCKAAARRMVSIKHGFKPNAKNVDVYNDYYQNVYLHLHDSVKALSKVNAKITSSLVNRT